MKSCALTFFVVIGILIISGNCSWAQSTLIVKGKLVDNSSRILKLKNIALLRVDSKSEQLVKESTTDSFGNFIFFISKKNISIGTYRLLILGQGVKKIKMYSDFSIKDSSSAVDLGTIIATIGPIQLDEVEVFAARPLYNRKLDKLVVNVEGSILASGNSLGETLLKLPGVKIEPGGNITVNGKQGVLITIDGKGQFVNNEQIQVLLSTIKSESIKQLEIIANPSSKFDANQGSVINVVTKKDNALSDVNFNYGTAIFPTDNLSGLAYPSINMGTNYNYKAGNFSSNISLKLTDDHQFRNYTVEKDYFSNLNTAKQDSSKSIYNEQKLDTHIGLSYDINKNSFVSADFLLIKNSQKEYINNDRINFLTLPHSQDSSINSTGKYALSHFYTYNLSLQYSLNIDTTHNKHIDVYYDLSNFQNPSNNNVNNIFYKESDLSHNTKFNSNQRYGVLYKSVKVDYKQDIGKSTQLFAGLKYSKILSDQTINASNINESDNFNQLSTGKFNYDESIYGAYLMLSKKAGIFEGEVGLRSEFTNSNSHLNSVNKLGHWSYNNLFPSLNLLFTLDENNKITFSYNKRIVRVNLSSLNPILNYTTPFVLTKGNPKLSPQFINYFELDYQYKQLYLSATYSRSDNSGIDVPILTNSASYIINKFENVKKIRAAEFDAEYPIFVTKWWSTINDVTLANTLSYLDRQNVSYWSYSLSSNQHFIFNKSLSLELLVTYNSKYRGYYSVYSGIYLVNLGLRKSFFSKKLDLNITCADVLGSNKFQITSSYPTQESNFKSIKNNRYLNLTLKYNFKSGRAFNKKSNISKGEFGEKRN